MNGANYYTLKKGNVRFFALDSNYMDAKQLACDGRFVPLNRVRRKAIDPNPTINHSG
jgi:hypothetical protein